MQNDNAEHNSIAPVSSRALRGTDIISILVIGEAFAWLLLVIYRSVDVDVPLWILRSLPFAMPPVALFFLWGSAVLGRKRPTLFQLGKYAAVGFLNAALDFGVLNLLVLSTGITAGIKLGMLNAVSFTIAVTNSYFWNKFWTFKANEKGVGASEFMQFIIVSLIGLVLNSSFVSLMTAFIAPPFGQSPQQWVNVVKVMAIVISVLWNFAGYKFIVFRKKKPEKIDPIHLVPGF